MHMPLQVNAWADVMVVMAKVVDSSALVQLPCGAHVLLHLLPHQASYYMPAIVWPPDSAHCIWLLVQAA
jgi:hypothetical protein